MHQMINKQFLSLLKGTKKDRNQTVEHREDTNVLIKHP